MKKTSPSDCNKKYDIWCPGDNDDNDDNDDNNDD